VPFCTNCGTLVQPSASFCHQCGRSQPRPAAQFTDFLGGLSDRTASILCYIPVFGVIPSIVFLASQKYRTNTPVRFNAFQSLYLFVAWLIVASAEPGWGFHFIFFISKLLLFACWIYLLVKAANYQRASLPILGDLARRSTTEQL